MSLYSHDYDSRNYYPAAPVIDIVVSKIGTGGTEMSLTALVDSGADATMLPFDTLKTVGARYVETRQMRGVTGQPVTVDTYLASVTIGPHTLRGIEVIAMIEGTEAVIGRDVLNQLVVTLNGLAHIVEISN